MAHYINQLLAKDSGDQKYLIIMGQNYMNHWSHNFGVPQRVFAEHPGLKDQAAFVIGRESDDIIDVTKDEDEIMKGFKLVFGEEGTNPADYMYISIRMDQQLYPDQLIQKFEAMVQMKEETDPMIYDVFLEMIKMSLETMKSDPETSVNMLHTLTYFSNELFFHMRDKKTI